MVRSVLTLGDRSVREVMSPRKDIDWIDVKADQDELRRTAVETVHSRLIVADGELENVVDVVLTKEVLVGFLSSQPVDIRALAGTRELLMVPDVSDVMGLMDKLRVAPLQIALIYDEHGSITGVVTPTDILEAIAGEFPDEDESLSEVSREDGNTWVFEGWAGIDRVSAAVNDDLSDPDENYTTINGFVLLELGEKPGVGTRLETRGLHFEVLEMDNLVVGKIRISRP